MRAVIPALAVILCAAGSIRADEAAAQDISSPYRFIEERQEAGFFAGYMSAKTGRFGYGPSGGLWLGGRYGLELSGPLSIEGVAGLVRGTRDIINPRRPEGDRIIGEADALIPTVEGRLKLSLVGRRAWRGLSPFLVTGGGVAWDVAAAPEADEPLESDEVFDFGSSFFGTAGIGTRWYVSERFTLRTDAIFSLWNISTPVGFGDPELDSGPVQEGEWVRGLSITGSLLFRW
ncbi:MAG TPA: hypothetical protein VMM35_09665 [Longimicrobiales bacterium]|nr:hypothetical protein [Longimicrobiales bacterium]